MRSACVLVSVALCLAALFGEAAADLPVHCLRSDVLGKWTLSHSAQTFDRHVDCRKFTRAAEMQVELSMPNVAKDDKGNEGTWTMIYDEGMEIRINGNRYFSFFEFQRPDYEKSNMHRSFCGMTLRSQGGSFHDDEVKQWGCFLGVKNGENSHRVSYVSHDGKKNWESCQTTRHGECDLSAASVAVQDDSPSDIPDNVVSPIARNNNNNNDVQEEEKDNSRDEEEDDNDADVDESPAVNDDEESSIYADDAAAEEEEDLELDLDTSVDDQDEAEVYKSEDELVELINLSQSSYKAKLYPDLFEGKTINDISLMAGGIPFKQVVAEHMSAMGIEPAAADNELSNSATANLQFGTYDEDFDAGLPESWDWRNVDGVNYLFEPTNQGSCGSCFAVATTDMIQSRARIITKNRFNKRLATQDILSCGSRYAQGCKGGFPFLASKFVSDYGITTEECMQYRAETGVCPREKSCRHQQRVFAKNYHYVGGYYGACNARQMMQELMKNGPIVVGFQANMALMHYSSGVFLEMGEIDAAAKNFFEPTNHAVLVVGWGREKASGKRYWIAKNSWGKTWGEDGYFRIERGRDMAHFESMAVAATPVVPEHMMQ